MRVYLVSVLLLAAALLGAGCSDAQPAAPVPATSSPPASDYAPAAEIETRTPTAAPAPPTETVAPFPSAVPPLALCSPLGDTALADLTAMVSNPYHPPRPGFDDPHAGVDLAMMLPGSRVAVSGEAVTTALAGQVVMVSSDRFPFGSALVIETPLDQAAAALLGEPIIPTPAPTLPPLSALTCPPYPPLSIEGSERSLYILYAHLRDAPAWKQGDVVSCGQVIGAVGDSGNALNPHLHFETRVGPKGLYLNPMAHYDASATSEEMTSYCLWSVSGLFQLVDPMQVLSAAAAQP